MDPFQMIHIDKAATEHMYIQIYKSIADLIRQGQIKSNVKLPPIRSLAEQLGVNNVTIVKAYDELEKEGYVHKKIGSGTYVKPMDHHGGAREPFEDVGRGLEQMDRGQIHIHSDMISFSSATPTPDLFPVEDFKNLLIEILDRDAGSVFGYQESQGYYPLRESLVSYLQQYGICTSVNHVQIITGAQQGIDVISKAFVEYGDAVIVEYPTYTGAIATFKSRGAKIIEIPILPDGMDMDKLEEKIQEYKPKLIYTMPNFQNPTGYSYNSQKKKQLLELAYKYNVLIVEDDYLSDLNFNGYDAATLKSMDMQDVTIYIKSFSKVFMPGLRLGFLVIPSKLHPQILAAKHASDISTSGLNQRAFDLYLRKGIWKHHIQFMQRIYEERFEIMVRCLNEYIIPLGVCCSMPQGGLNFWLCLPEGFSSNELYRKCEENNLLILPGSIFSSNQKESPCFRLSIAAVYPDQIKLGIKKLSEILERMIGKKESSNIHPYFPIL
ncbi:DNA-binding transcriptional MocR family regulator [Anaerosolibacter carboniphilus]|uniref:DNA-binding transcriptional MocR family regulator n=1 Tax=Anaerosolibacter carboniphilus TaxID=1417629 RepID=A0A841KQ95_9FIRM|nr:PLP-dependent aminotransferase family protein [Anaerosolibacter carboniphilus]MBB6215656.1 DNA-binding transcriptional MocR family regulator [Anaerosolibacter carboniphilus]